MSEKNNAINEFLKKEGLGEYILSSREREAVLLFLHLSKRLKELEKEVAKEKNNLKGNEGDKELNGRLADALDVFHFMEMERDEFLIGEVTGELCAKVYQKLGKIGPLLFLKSEGINDDFSERFLIEDFHSSNWFDD